MYVKSLLPAGAAHRSSLVQVGDCLRKIDGKKVLGKPVDKVSLSLSLTLSDLSLVNQSLQASDLSLVNQSLQTYLKPQIVSAGRVRV